MIPLETLGPSPTGRRGGGCVLQGHSSLDFVFERRTWSGPAAVLVCDDEELVDSFAVLAGDVIDRVGESPTWAGVHDLFDEWQTLLARRGVPSPEKEIGLWGELWFIAQASDVDRLLAAWRGPDGDASDFFLDGRAAEIKTSRSRRRHHVSQSQIVAPVGVHPARLVSCWVVPDPVGGRTVPELWSAISRRSRDEAAALKCVSAAYRPTDHASYATRLRLLAAPEWYPLEAVPRVTAADTGVSQVRYVVALDERHAMSAADTTAWRRHFLHADNHGEVG